MKAFAITEPSQRSLEQITLIELPKPTIKPDQVLIKVKAAGLNPVDYKVAESGVDAWQYPHIPGLDVAGVVVAVGENVRGFAVGDRVSGHGDLTQNGCFAEFAAVPAYQLAKIPNGVSFEQAVALLCGAMTAYQAVHRKADLANRKTVLVHNAAGGVGAIAVQLAKSAGLTVYATASSAKTDFVRRLNAADAIIDYRTENVTEKISHLTDGKGVDLIINTTSGAEAAEDLKRLAYNGALVAIVDAPDFTQAALSDRAQSVCMVNLGGAHRSANPAQQADLGTIAQALLDLTAAGKLNPVLERKVDFSEIPQALADIKARRTIGKTVATIK